MMSAWRACAEVMLGSKGRRKWATKGVGGGKVGAMRDCVDVRGRWVLAVTVYDILLWLRTAS